jgi:hypothetical protein
VGSNGLRRGHWEVSQSHSGELAAVRFPDDPAQSVGSRSCPNLAKQGGGQALIGNRAVRHRHRGHLSLDGLSQAIAIASRSISGSRSPMPGGGSSWSRSGNAGDGRASVCIGAHARYSDVP